MSFRKPKRGQVQQRISDEERIDKARQELFAFYKQMSELHERSAKLYELSGANYQTKAQEQYRSAAESSELCIEIMEEATAERLFIINEITNADTQNENGD